MAEEHATNWLGKSVAEFGKLPPMGKAAVVGLVGGVAYLAIRARMQATSTVGLAPDQSTPADAGSVAGVNYPANGPTSTGTVGVPGPPGPPGPIGAPGAPGYPGGTPPVVHPSWGWGPPPKKPVNPGIAYTASVVPRPQLRSYTVSPGESVAGIAGRLGVSYQALSSRVGGSVTPGQRINIAGLR